MKQFLAANVCFAATLLLAATSMTSELREGSLDTNLVPSPVNYSVLLPDGYSATAQPHPLLLLLHGGKNSHTELRDYWKKILDDLWASGAISKMVVAMTSTGQPTLEGRSEYVDFHDGTERWYSYVSGPFLSHIRQKYNVSADRAHTVIGGYSMGGLGALRFAFNSPDRFAGVAGWEPSVLPAYYWKDVKARNRFHYSDEFLQRRYGTPLDKHWERNNPALLVKANADAIRAAGLQIYIECGDEDYLNLHEGTEFLHRVLWDHRIPHEYHTVRGADHLGRTVVPRAREGLQFLDRALHPLGEDRDPQRLEMIETFRELKARAEQEKMIVAPPVP